MKNKIKHLHVVYGLAIIICLLCAVLIGYASGYITSEKKNQAYIKATYPPIKDLVRMKFEKDLLTWQFNSIQTFQDPNDYNIFYFISSRPGDLTHYYFYKADLSIVPNYINTYISADSEPFITLIFTREVSAEKRVRGIFMDNTKLVFNAIYFKADNFGESCNNSWFNQNVMYEEVDSFMYIDVNGKNPIERKYTLTSETQIELESRIKKCSEETYKDREKEALLYQQYLSSQQQELEKQNLSQ